MRGPGWKGLPGGWERTKCRVPSMVKGALGRVSLLFYTTRPEEL